MTLWLQSLYQLHSTFKMSACPISRPYYVEFISIYFDRVHEWRSPTMNQPWYQAIGDWQLISVVGQKKWLKVVINGSKWAQTTKTKTQQSTDAWPPTPKIQRRKVNYSSFGSSTGTIVSLNAFDVCWQVGSMHGMNFSILNPYLLSILENTILHQIAFAFMAQTSANTNIDIGVFWWNKKNGFFTSENHFLVPLKTNCQTYIFISNGQKFELLVLLFKTVKIKCRCCSTVLWNRNETGKAITLNLLKIESSSPLFKHCTCKIVNWFTAQRFVSNTVASWNDKLFDKSPYSACRQPFYLCKAMRTWVKAALRHADYADLSQNATLHGSSIDSQLIKAFQFNSH